MKSPGNWHVEYIRYDSRIRRIKDNIQTLSLTVLHEQGSIHKAYATLYIHDDTEKYAELKRDDLP